MKKKALSVLLACLLAISLLPAGGMAAGAGASAAAPAFDDVSAGAWYYNAVQYAAQNDLMSGVGGNSFAPDGAMTRAMLVTVLYRLDGSKKPDKTVSFTDLDASSWCYDAAEWAAANGIVQADGQGAFGAGTAVTRQEFAMMLQAYAAHQGRVTALASADLSGYSDVSSIAASALGAVKWALSVGLFTGAAGSALMPDGIATRAQTAAVLQRYITGTTLEKRTADYVSQFVKDDFGTFYADSSDKLRQSITQDTLLKGWKSILEVTGIPGDLLGSVYTKQKGYDVVVCAVSATLYNIRVTITYDGAGKPISSWINYIPKDSPVPQSTEAWEEISVTVGDKDLPGFLTLPKGVQKPPVVILIQGSGAHDMDEALGTAPNRPFADIAHGLAGQGIATLRYNKRTYQYPAGGDPSIQYEMLDDAAAAVKLLGNDSRVDMNRIYLLGHSLGGMMAPKIAADNPQIKGFISMAGSLRPLRDISYDQNKAAAAAMTNLTEQQKAAGLAQVKAELDKTITLDDGGTGASMGIATSYWKSLNDIDGVAIVKNLSIPMLILQGGADFQVYPGVDYKLWQSTLADRSNVTFKLYDGLSHLFMTNQIPANGVPDASVYNAPNHVDPAVISDISAWVHGR